MCLMITLKKKFMQRNKQPECLTNQARSPYFQGQ